MSAITAPLPSRSRIPRATYRLQFHENFRLRHAISLAPYLRALGISHVYASPLFKAKPHSPHGYDVCDFNQLNPEIGTEADLEELVTALHQNEMGLVLDIVPNHMGIGRENPWWWDVLAHGRESKFANHFDIDWDSPDPRLRGKVLAPILGDAYETVLKRGELKLLRTGDGLTLHYFDHAFPVTSHASHSSSTSSEALDALLQNQHYLLTLFSEGDKKLNYRRFFTITSLAGIRVEDEKVFNESHALIKKWLARGWIDGLRVDHPDGLRDPQQYLQRLRALAPDAWIVVEKILESEEKLPHSWPVAGTTGYDFLNRLNVLLIDSNAEKPLTDFYGEFTGEPTDYSAVVSEKKRAILRNSFTTEVNRLVELLQPIVERHVHGQKFSREECTEALIELAVFTPVYRTYIRDGLVSDEDIAHLQSTVTAAKNSRADLAMLFASLGDALQLRWRSEIELDFVARFQQLTGPAMAKGVEDTAFYCFNRLISLNEVGGDPGKFGASADQFHESCRIQQADWPHAMLATATHDTKRGEDMRARLNVLSEIPDRWSETISRWSKMNERHRSNNFPDRNAEYLLYQTLVGAWPVSVERTLVYAVKAVREAKQHTNWTLQNENYETALREFIIAIFGDTQFMKDLEAFVGSISDFGFINSLSQTLIKLTAPGVPDIYQGCELLDFSLVDPDNRRQVDFETRRQFLEEIKHFSPEEIWKRRATGLPKLFLIQRTLDLRKRQPDLFLGSYEPLRASGQTAEHIVAFIRSESMISMAPRLSLRLNNEWSDTVLALPAGTWRNELTNDVCEGAIEVEKLLKRFPVALLSKEET